MKYLIARLCPRRLRHYFLSAASTRSGREVRAYFAMGVQERSTWQAIAIIGTCTLSMMLTVSTSYYCIKY